MVKRFRNQGCRPAKYVCLMRGMETCIMCLTSSDKSESKKFWKKTSILLNAFLFHCQTMTKADMEFIWNYVMKNLRVYWHHPENKVTRKTTEKQRIG